MHIKNIKIGQIFFLLLFLCSCNAVKERKSNEQKNVQAYKMYLISRNIDPIKVNDLDYYDDYFDFKKEQKAKALQNNIHLKVNSIYIYEGPNLITFCIFSDEGKVYLNRINKSDSEFIVKSLGNFYTIKQKIKLDFLGNFALQDSIIRVSRNERSLYGKEWDECDFGYANGDIIHFVQNYNTKKFDYKKKWLAKTRKTDYKFLYQPTILFLRFERTKDYNPYYLIEGSFEMIL